MDIRHDKKHDDLKHDPILDVIESARSYVEKNRNRVLTALSCVVFVAVAVQGFFVYRAHEEQKAMNAFGKATVAYAQNPMSQSALDALADVEARYGSTTQGIYSAYLEGTIYYDRGSLDESLAKFVRAASGSPRAGFVRGEAVEGIGKCYEAKGDYTKALASYEKVLADKDISFRYAAIMYRMALINQKLKNFDKVKELCAKVEADTLASAYRQKALNLAATAELQ